MQDAFNQVMLMLAAAVFASTVFRRLQLPPVLAYMLVGAALGPYGMGWLNAGEELNFLSELGLVFLLFSLGLEFSLPRMLALRQTVFALGGAQVVVSSLIMGLGLWGLLGLPGSASIVVAGALALSSTAIVTQELSRWKELNTAHGTAAIGILLFQDLAAVVFLILVPALAGDQESTLSWTLLLMLGKGLVLFAGMLTLGRWLMPRIFHEVSKTRSDELFVLTVLLVALTAGWITHAVGLSMALGAFIAGMLLGESHFRHQIEADIRPFRDILLGLFFISVGMLVDPSSLFQHWVWVLIGLVVLLLGKALLITVIARFLGHSPEASFRTGVVLAQGGEFGFALLSLAVGRHVVPEETAAVVVTIIILSIALTPMLVRYSGSISQRWLKPVQPETPSSPLASAHHELNDHVIICGFGRVGQILHRFLTHEQIPHIAVDHDPVRVQAASMAGAPVVYGDVSRHELLKGLGAEHARLIVVTVNDRDATLRTLHALQPLSLAQPILVRTQDDSDLERLKDAGATAVIPEVLEGSLTLVSQVLMCVGMSDEQVAATVQQTRNERYRLLHGFFHGRASNVTDETGRPLERRHSVSLVGSAWAVGHSVAEVRTLLQDVEVLSLKRADGEELEAPDGDLVLASEDTLVLFGTSEQVEEAEHHLLAG
ncbi:hypothetical protein BFW38_01770 [Terasakiispira papahanaumokuakeensis]|uniref:Sodium:proton antiporter n=1 Tax=Terasakiispira papahanaumokuakeensis TaxID=197479 RepID=A0A1E2V623_9GAMM|nr:monovalent cation:proton antiporter-2 (CPA2) family protein [Terasakiispira papahanaumokuakeensis]ODC02460.1 hypothetical protein BFW38_01770 [Terasakiispira papahanaumokuakeensis]